MHTHRLRRWLISRLLFGVLPIVVIVSAFIVLAHVNRDLLLLRGSSGFLHHFTGFRNTVGCAEFLPDGGGYLIKDVTLRNPNVFRIRPEFAVIKALRIELDKPPKKDGKIVVKRVVLDMDAINVVLWDRGVLNLSYLSGMRKKTNEMLGLQTLEEQAPRDDFLFLIRRLEVSIGDVTYTDTTGRRSAQSMVFAGKRSFVFNDLCGIPEVIRAVCALIVADRPIPSENLPVNTYVARYLGVAPQPVAVANASQKNQEPDKMPPQFNPNAIGQTNTGDESVQRPQETELTNFGQDGEEPASPPAQ